MTHAELKRLLSGAKPRSVPGQPVLERKVEFLGYTLWERRHLPTSEVAYLLLIGETLERHRTMTGVLKRLAV
jgi:hypothetical protein